MNDILLLILFGAQTATPKWIQFLSDNPLLTVFGITILLFLLSTLLRPSLPHKPEPKPQPLPPKPKKAASKKKPKTGHKKTKNKTTKPSGEAGKKKQKASKKQGKESTPAKTQKAEKKAKPSKQESQNVGDSAPKKTKADETAKNKGKTSAPSKSTKKQKATETKDAPKVSQEEPKKTDGEKKETETKDAPPKAEETKDDVSQETSRSSGDEATTKNETSATQDKTSKDASKEDASVDAPKAAPQEEKPAKVEEEETEAMRARRARSAALKAKRKARLKDVKLGEEKGNKSDSKDDIKTLRSGVQKMRGGWLSKLNTLLLGKKKLDETLLDELEEILYTADIGTRTVEKLLQSIEEQVERSSLSDPSQVKEAIKQQIRDILHFENPHIEFGSESPFIVMVVGVNGVGKTTTIGKMSARLSKQGRKVLLVAGDTFRAAASEQLGIWAEQVEADIVQGQPNQDPSSVVFDGIKKGVARDFDIVIADTAGRLHTQQNLMEELKKVKRVVGRAHESAPHEVLLVLDATTGQNALNQARQFNEALGVTGIALTKLDGTAKGGIIVAITDELNIPIRYIGVGEHIDELRTFSADEFVDALFDD